MEPTPGQQVTTNLRLVRELGAGGMGSVWVADHLGLDTQVAVKFIATEIARKSPTVVERFKREAAAAAKIKSPHVVQVLDHGLTADGTPYIAMELLDGESLQDRLRRCGALSLEDTALVVYQTSQVLARAHALGIVHRDIKPANLFLVETGYDIFVKVLDFGIAKNADAMKDLSVTATGAMLGSPLYMSPEQFTSAKGVDRRADLWSLSVVAYHCLAGQPSFRGETLGQVMLAVMNRTYDPVTTLAPGLPAPLDAFFAKAFAAEIDARFQSAAELGQVFQAICLRLGGGPDLAQTMDLGETAKLPDTSGRWSAPPSGAPERSGAFEAAHDSSVRDSSVRPDAGSAAYVRPSQTFEPSASTLAGPARRRGLVWAIGAGVMALGAMGAIAFTQRGAGPSQSQDDPAAPVVVAPAAGPDEADEGVPDEPPQVPDEPRVDEGVPEERRDALDEADAGGQPVRSPPVAPVAAPQPADRRPEPPAKRLPKASPGETDYGF